MRSRKLNGSILAAGLALVISVWQAAPARAEGQEGQQIVVAKVGSVTISAADVQRRMAGIPPFQLKSFGRDANEVRRNFLERVLIKEALLAQGAAASDLVEKPEIKDRLRGALRTAMLNKLRAEAASSQPVKAEDVKGYYDANPAKYKAPARVSISQIVVAKKEEAEEILARLQKDGSPKTFGALARERSIDKATKMRDGNLGFVQPDGVTSEPGMKADPAVVEAVSVAKDGEIIPHPIQVAQGWAVVMRRQGMAGHERPFELETGPIRQILVHERADARIRSTLERLRKERLTEYEPANLDELEVSPTGDLGTPRRPGAAVRRGTVNAIPVKNPLGGAR